MIGVGTGVSRYNNLGLCDEYTTVYNAMPIKPNFTDAIRQNDLIKTLVSKGIYAKAEVFDLFSVGEESNSLINWKNPGIFTPSLVGDYNPSSVGEARFEAYAGIRGTGNPVSCINLNYTPSTDAVLTSQNNFCAIIGIGSDSQSSYMDFGSNTTSPTASGIFLTGRHPTGDLAYYRMNNNTSTPLGDTNSIKYLAASRGSVATYDIYLNKSKTIVTSNSTGFTNQMLYVCGYNNNGTIRSTDKRIRFAFIFSYLTEAEINDVIDVMEKYLSYYHTNIIDYDKYIASAISSTKAVVSLTTYDGSGQTCHPSVVNPGITWNNYKYWMANTPLPNGDNAYENPSIWASNDGVTWIVPDGITNPIIAKPVGDGAFNSDVDLFYNSSDNKMYLIYRQTTSVTEIRIISSTDGINWSAPKVLLTYSGDIKMTSPSLIKIGTIYYIYYNNFSTSAPGNSKLQRISSSTIDGTYTNPEDLNAPIIGILGFDWFHLDIVELNGIYWLSSNIAFGSNPGFKIFIMKSTDGVNFYKSPYPTVYQTDLNLTTEDSYYRPSLALIEGKNILYYGTVDQPSGSYGLSKVEINLY